MRRCSSCGEDKELEAFAFRNKAAGRHHQKCKTCVAEYGRSHYAGNRRVYIDRTVSNNRARRGMLKQQVWEHLAEHPCVDCGEQDPVVLEFDHLDPTTKRSEIYWLVQSAYGWGTTLAEIARCQVRCANCHRRRTAIQFNWPKLIRVEDSELAQTASADTAARQRLRAPLRPLDGFSCNAISRDQHTLEVVPSGQRRCPWCGHAKPQEQFHLRSKATGVRHTICGECFTGYRRAHYRLNREDYIRRNTRLLRVRGRKWTARLADYVRHHPCVDCGEPDPAVLEFDHVDRALKRQTVGFLARSGYAWRTVEAELAKCEVRCANCHRRRTAVQFDWPKLRFVPRT